QEIAYRYYRDHIEATLPTLRMRYKTQADAMKKAIDDYLPGSRTDPKGGFFIWQTLDTSMDANKLLESALKSGIIFVPGDGFYPYNGLFVDDSYRMITRRIPKKNEIRLSFSSMKPEEITKGIEELSLVIESATD
ncbi:MAG: hypothetical protein OEZ01_16420, partial [Candidatus Heimdallarchaeota archaeon]|nr:hypothetical protein [Candidatus Heimdallarchaeota archaeon]